MHVSTCMCLPGEGHWPASITAPQLIWVLYPYVRVPKQGCMWTQKNKMFAGIKRTHAYLKKKNTEDHQKGHSQTTLINSSMTDNNPRLQWHAQNSDTKFTFAYVIILSALKQNSSVSIYDSSKPTMQHLAIHSCCSLQHWLCRLIAIPMHHDLTAQQPGFIWFDQTMFTIVNHVWSVSIFFIYLIYYREKSVSSSKLNFDLMFQQTMDTFKFVTCSISTCQQYVS